MPVHLPCVSRRHFLKSSLVLGAGSTLFPQKFAFSLGESRSEDVWALISDTHIPGDRTQENGGVNPVNNLVEIRKDILAHPKKPCGAIISGDCVYLHGKITDYPTLLEEFQPIRDSGMSVHFILGNHDHRSNFLNALAVHEQKPGFPNIPENLCSVLETPKVNWFFLDSLQRTNFTPGVLGESQLQWLQRELDARRDKPALLVAHHNPVFNLPVEKRWAGHLKDTDELWDVILPRKQVKGYIYGHLHQWKTAVREGIHIVCIPATAWKFRDEEPTAWILAELSEGGLSLTPRCLDMNHPTHEKTVSLTWR